MCAPCRAMVSLEKRRFQQDGFNLDLAYITERIIAMGFPASGKEYFYRNPWKQAQKFLMRYHQTNFKVYNLCCEKNRQYDPARFFGQVENFPFEDHQAPPLGLIMQFCENVDQFLKESDRNVIAVHCKAGKGRTGLMICAYLLYCGLFDSYKKVLQYYGEKRTKDGKGVTIPSQIRFIKYYNTILDKGFPEEKAVLLSKFFISPIPVGLDIVVVIYVRQHDSMSAKSDIKLEINFAAAQQCYQYTDSSKERVQDVEFKRAGSTLKITFDKYKMPDLTGDIKFVAYKNTIGKKNMLFSSWFNTAFIPETNRLVALREDLDKVKSSLPSDLKVVFNFANIDEAGDSLSRGKRLLAVGQGKMSEEVSPREVAMTIGERPHFLDDIEIDDKKEELASHVITDPPTRENSQKEETSNVIVAKDSHIENLEMDMVNLKSIMKEMMDEQQEKGDSMKRQIDDLTSDKRMLELELVEKTQDFSSALFDLEQQLSYSKEEIQKLKRDNSKLEEKVADLESVPTDTLNAIIEDLEEQNRELRTNLSEKERSNKIIEETFADPQTADNFNDSSKGELVGALNLSIDKMHKLMSLLKQEQESNKVLNKKLQYFINQEKDMNEFEEALEYFST